MSKQSKPDKLPKGWEIPFKDWETPDLKPWDMPVKTWEFSLEPWKVTVVAWREPTLPDWGELKPWGETDNLTKPNIDG